ncbi:MAG: ferrochelatase [Bacteroidales bacterium]|nr:ferrochelatase [Bacteroidales bacterium]
MSKRGVLLINVGTPESTSLFSVQKYLSQFLGDKRVINLPSIAKKILVNGLIVPFRAPRSRKLYQKLWTENGSPLLYYSVEIQKKLQKQLGDDYSVYLGMRYGKPSLKLVIDKLEKDNLKEIIVLPLFPQYASATTGTAIDYLFKLIRKWNTIPKIKILNQFYDNQGFIKAFSNNIKTYLIDNYDHILFSYHGLPLKQVFDSHDKLDCEEFNCSNEINDNNKYCYHATCYATTRLLAKSLELSKNQYTVCFQSRFTKKWLTPFTDEVIIQKAREGNKKLLVVSPSFVTDCLETIVEIGDDYKQLFIANGGEHLQLVESLNDGDDWVKALQSIILR